MDYQQVIEEGGRCRFELNPPHTPPPPSWIQTLHLCCGVVLLSWARRAVSV